MNERTFTELVNTEQAGLAAYFARRGVPWCDREELVQESLVLVWRLRERIRPGKDRSFLYGVAWRLLQAHRRKQAPRLAMVVEGLPEEAIEPPPANGSDALQFMALLAREETEHLRGILEKLPTRQREVIQSIYFENRTLTQTAERLRVRVETVHTHHHRALARLKALLVAGDGA